MPDKVKTRRSPAPWTFEDHNACFIVKDHSGYALAYVYYESRDVERQPIFLTKDEARRIAANMSAFGEHRSGAISSIGSTAALFRRPSLPRWFALGTRCHNR